MGTVEFCEERSMWSVKCWLFHFGLSLLCLMLFFNEAMNMNLFHKEKFKGDEKVLIHFLAPYEPKFIEAVLPYIPRQIGTVHLTLMTIIWSSAIILAGYFAKNDIRWLWLFSSCILFQYITDMLDGAVEIGRAHV